MKCCSEVLRSYAKFSCSNWSKTVCVTREGSQSHFLRISQGFVGDLTMWSAFPSSSRLVLTADYFWLRLTCPNIISAFHGALSLIFLVCHVIFEIWASEKFDQNLKVESFSHHQHFGKRCFLIPFDFCLYLRMLSSRLCLKALWRPPGGSWWSFPWIRLCPKCWSCHVTWPAALTFLSSSPCCQCHPSSTDQRYGTRLFTTTYLQANVLYMRVQFSKCSNCRYSSRVERRRVTRWERSSQCLRVITWPTSTFICSGRTTITPASGVTITSSTPKPCVRYVNLRRHSQPIRFMYSMTCYFKFPMKYTYNSQNGFAWKMVKVLEHYS